MHRNGRCSFRGQELKPCRIRAVPPLEDLHSAGHKKGRNEQDHFPVEVTSEEKEYPVESALVSGEMRGWRAVDSGTQTLRLIFDEPQRLTRISLVFEESETERTQEFVLRWSPDGGCSFR